MADPPITALSLFSGLGGLELGLRLALGDRLRVLGYVEREAYAAAALLARMEDEALEPAPVWCGNVEDFDASCFAGVDLVCAGFPCQPASHAGDRRGTADERWLWPEIERVLAEVQPRFFFGENVPGLLTVDGEQCCGVPLRRGVDGSGSCRLCGRIWGVEESADLVAGGAFGEVLGSLATLGFDAEWDLFSAAEVGAPHRRERLFVLAYRQGEPGQLLDRQREAGRDEADASRSCGALAYRDGGGLAQLGLGGLLDGERASSAQPCRDQRERPGDAADDGGEDVADAGHEGLPQPERSALTCRPTTQLHRSSVGNAEGGSRQDGTTQGAGARRPAGDGVDVGDPTDERYQQPWAARRRRTGPADAGPVLGDAIGLDAALGECGAEPGAFPAPFPPGPGARDEWAAILTERPDLAPAVESNVRLLADGSSEGMVGRVTSTRVDELRALGNGVISLTAAVAFCALAERAGLTMTAQGVRC